MCNHLLMRNSTFKADSSHEQSGILNGEGYSARGSATLDGKIELGEVWKAGDKVLVLPTGDGQKFFIIDIVREVQ
ncbi:MAG: DUF2577 family protein [Peptococcaceae bacterium]|nr:DUF2577 family protein [Peptococcaceae bacterium]